MFPDDNNAICNLDCGQASTRGQPDRGYCKLNVGCVCFSPYIGKNCESQVITIPQPDIDKEKPDTNIDFSDDLGNIKSIISIVALREIDYITLKPVYTYNFDKWNYTKISDSKNQYLTNLYSNNSIMGSKNQLLLTTVNVTLEWFSNQTNITFANEQLSMNPSSMKYTIGISKYKFVNKLNSLQIILMSQIESSKTNDVCSSKEFSDSEDSNYIRLQIDKKSFYGRFIKRALVDDSPVIVRNELLDKDLNAIGNSNKIQSFIGIMVPNYQTNIILDPDWSVLLDSKNANSNSNDSICTKKKSLTTSQLAGIIIGSVAFFCIIVLIIIKVIYSSPRFLSVKIFFYKLFKKT
ncbi:hypothetical protein DICPUDRAFT_36445 [Dictyostelium purpureum]|uniref:EGF-like domain-containing protein n=1 Tax=Dictyostelium purpureum TaxID=5786 RepID=F0ZR37_DICPU|nr:uncharacterized protein DICPUDRAFT_36445 [Dictyostelium purpureum]EGC33606.1 hypothetical protein DICPUDRAFT_36445 [Dictyostelium purpureum]|eukprot:XP_003289874.1 hypothetical protein DICPUDRAFT_36445 [Dictyostelium purpureum]